jgi:hypothetical protein
MERNYKKEFISEKIDLYSFIFRMLSCPVCAECVCTFKIKLICYGVELRTGNGQFAWFSALKSKSSQKLKVLTGIYYKIVNSVQFSLPSCYLYL